MSAIEFPSRESSVDLSGIQQQIDAKANTADVNTALDLKQNKFSIATKSSLTIDLSEANYFLVSISTNQGFDLTNLAVGIWTFNITNTGGADITIPIPNTANDIFQVASVTIKISKTTEISLASDGTKRFWLVSPEMGAA